MTNYIRLTTHTIFIFNFRSHFNSNKNRDSLYPKKIGNGKTPSLTHTLIGSHYYSSDMCSEKNPSLKMTVEEEEEEWQRLHSNENAQRQQEQNQLSYKCQLVIYAQRARIDFPVYQTINEASCTAPPKFRSSVLVDGVNYTSPNTFSQVKAAEHDAARHALDTIAKKSTAEAYARLQEDRHFCKSILNELAAKMNVKLPSYIIEILEGPLSMFRASSVFNGVKYTGEAAISKKEAEQLAARAVLFSVLGNMELEMHLLEIIRSKARLYTLSKKSENPSSFTSMVPMESNFGSEIGQHGGDANKTEEADVASNRVHLQSDEHEELIRESSSKATGLPSTYASSHQVVSPQGDLKKNRRSRKKANKQASASDTSLRFGAVSKVHMLRLVAHSKNGFGLSMVKVTGNYDSEPRLALCNRTMSTGRASSSTSSFLQWAPSLSVIGLW
ncbi:Double-stranded RNA-binding protein 4-like protein [Drosera capensis]